MIDLLTPDWPAPDVVVACSTLRTGGDSRGVYATANFGDHVGDSLAVVARHRRQLQRALPGRPHLAWLKQVHGVAVVAANPEQVAVADAQWTAQPGLACTVLTADCLPVLFCDREGTRVAAAHAGWRGLAAGVLEGVLDALAIPSERVLAWLGPAISVTAFEVGPEVRDAFLQGPGSKADLAAAFMPGSAGRWHADLYHLARLRLAARGVHAVYGGDHCTHGDPQRFYSYRRDGLTGRQASLIYLRAA